MPGPSALKRFFSSSRSLSATESRYNQMEKEALAMAWVVECFEQFVEGIQFDVPADHRSLVMLLDNTELDLIPPQIQQLQIRLWIRLLHFQFRVLYVPGKLIVTTNTLPGSGCHTRCGVSGRLPGGLAFHEKCCEGLGGLHASWP